MSSPRLYPLIGMLFGFVLLAGIAGYTFETTGSTLATLAVVTITILVFMSFTLASFAVAQYLPDETIPLGPSTLMGFGVIGISLWSLFFVVSPGLPWVYVLPVDEQGRFDRASMLSIDFDAFEVPHHDTNDTE